MEHKALKSITRRRRMGLPPDVKTRLEQEDARMLEWLQSADSERGAQDQLEARQSGNEDWKEARGEAGSAM